MTINGTYRIEISTPIGKQSATMTLRPKVKCSPAPWKPPSVNMSLPALSTATNTLVPWRPRHALEYTGRVSGNKVEGKVKAGVFGEMGYKGRKI
jgi:hypothetical protein